MVKLGVISIKCNFLKVIFTLTIYNDNLATVGPMFASD